MIIDILQLRMGLRLNILTKILSLSLFCTTNHINYNNKYL